MIKSIAGDYNLGEKLYSYGLRTTSEAVNIKLSSKCALTLISVSPGPSLKALQKRAELSSKLNSTSLVTADDYGLASKEIFYYTHTLHKSRPLVKILPELPDGEQKIFGTLKFFLKFLEPIDYIHQAGLTHRDLQTAHLFITANGDALLEGFINTRPKKEPRTISHIVHLPFLAPEQLKGASADPKTDIYSLGVILFELFVGHLPYSSNFSKIEDMQEGTKSFNELKKADLPEAISFLIAKCLAPRKNRFSSAGELKIAAESIYKKRSLKMKWEDLSLSWKTLFSIK